MGKRDQSPRSKVQAARRAFERLDETTPDEARDEEGWTPELLAAGGRHLEAMREWLEWARRETERLKGARRDEEGPAWRDAQP
jgi:hypothetical protein